MARKNFHAVLELIHEAALSPAGWDNVLRRLASLTGCVAGGLTIERPATRQGSPLTYFGFDPTHVERTFDYFLPMNPLFGIEPRMQRGFIVSNEDVVAPDVFRMSEFYNGWARPQGLCSPVTVVLHRTPTCYVPLTLVRPDGTGDVTSDGRMLLSHLAPHLVHAMDVTLRLRAAEDARHEAATALEALPCGAMLIDRERRILFANGTAQRLLSEPGSVLACRSGRIAMRDPETDRQFQAAVALALGASGPAKSSQIPAQGLCEKRKLTISLSPLPQSDGAWSSLAGEHFGQARCLVLLSGTDITNVAEQYGLTPAETRMLSAIVTGRGLAAATRELGIARSTGQTHLDRIFQKTGTNRQAELVGLVRAGFGS